MSVKLRAIDRWRKAGASIPLPGGKRIVTVLFNVETRTKLSVLQNKSVTLLRVIEPFECPLPVSFIVEGDCSIVPESDGDVWWMSDDGDILAYSVTSESFTKLEQRMEMTEEMEITILRSKIRQEQRAREVAELLLEKEQRRQAAEAMADPETGEVPDETEVVVDADAGASEPDAAAGDSTPPKPNP